MQLVQDGQQIQFRAVATFLIIFGAHTNVPIIIKMKIHALMKWSYKLDPPNYVDHQV